jgi:hypothetical protein
MGCSLRSMDKVEIIDLYDKCKTAYNNYPDCRQREKIKEQMDELERKYPECVNMQKKTKTIKKS